MQKYRCAALALIVLWVLPGWAAKKHVVKVETVPADALVSVHKSEKPTRGEPRMVAGATPLTKEFDFGKAGRLWLEIEKRGYATRMLEITADKDAVSVTLDRIDVDGKPAVEYTTPQLQRVTIAAVARVYHHGFTKQTSSEEESRRAAESLAGGLRAALAGKHEVALAGAGAEDEDFLKPIWREVNGMQSIDPVRLRYLPPVFLETRSAREAARKIGERTGAEALLLTSVRQTSETTAMMLAKTGMMTGGTAASYSAGYANAVANRQSFFVYNLYLPSFAEGATINSVLIDCRTGEVLWANRGMWDALNFNNSEHLKKVAQDLLVGLP